MTWPVSRGSNKRLGLMVWIKKQITNLDSLILLPLFRETKQSWRFLSSTVANETSAKYSLKVKGLVERGWAVEDPADVDGHCSARSLIRRAFEDQPHSEHKNYPLYLVNSHTQYKTCCLNHWFKLTSSRVR